MLIGVSYYHASSALNMLVGSVDRSRSLYHCCGACTVPGPVSWNDSTVDISFVLLSDMIRIVNPPHLPGLASARRNIAGRDNNAFT